MNDTTLFDAGVACLMDGLDDGADVIKLECIRVVREIAAHFTYYPRILEQKLRNLSKNSSDEEIRKYARAACMAITQKTPINNAPIS